MHRARTFDDEQRIVSASMVLKIMEEIERMIGISCLGRFSSLHSFLLIFTWLERL